jgi:hypothetical protein
VKTLARRIINRVWIAACAREHARFSNALERVEETQRNYLLDLLRRNARTQFGEKNGFSKINTVAEFQQRVPQNSYEMLAPYIEAIARGEAKVLTADPVRLFQPTSGSTSGTKLIPWTDTVANEFRRGINPWLASLYQRQPALLDGTAYWSISPPATPQRTCGRLRVGFEHDAEYLGFFGRKFFSLISAVPTEVAHCRDMIEFRTRTLLHLLADENLRLISVWSPTFLTVLLEDFIARQDEILEMLAQFGLPGANRRSEFLKSISRAGRRSFTFEKVWPNLKVISCWTHGSSSIYAENLRRIFPGVEIQGKGLIATEAFVSFPFQEGFDPVLAVTAHFFEFQDPDTNAITLAHQLVAGREYQVIVTTGGGLYRYPLGDRVRVTGFVHSAPCFQFVSREGFVSDLFGEKLQAGFVEKVVRRAIAQQNIDARFFLLAPVADAQLGTSYTLFIETDLIPNPAGLQHHLEHGLAENFHYAHCRNLGQISPVRLFHIQQVTPSAGSVFVQEMQGRGIKAGNAKVMPLDGHWGWERRFCGKFIS